MRRFITYIYEYEQGNRGRNTGFIRTDLRENSCRMELQIRGFDRFKGKCPVYLTVYENGLQAIPVTELLLTQGMGSVSYTHLPKCICSCISIHCLSVRLADTLAFF